MSLAIIVFGYHPFYQYVPIATSLQHGLFDAFSRIGWSISLSYMIFACVHLHSSGGPINKFLSLAFWQPLSRLTFAIYLIHYYLIRLKLFSIETPPHFNGISVFQECISFFVLFAFIAVLLVLTFELPIDAINKLSASTKKPKIRTTPT